MRKARFALFWIIVIITGASAGALAQPHEFGSADDPREAFSRSLWRAPDHIYTMGGLSLIANRLRSISSIQYELNSRPVAARINATLRVGYHGIYQRDVSHAYDAVRAIEFIRYQSTPSSPLMLRAGPITRGRLGTGHLVNFYQSTAAWEERTVGVEASWRHPFLEVAGFTDNIFLNRVVGGRIAAQPFFWVADGRISTLELALNHVRDLASPVGHRGDLAGYNVEARFRALGFQDLHLTPFASYGWYEQLGTGMTLGLDFAGYNLIDLARFRIRFAVDYYSDEFIPGYFNNFYMVNNLRSRVWDSFQYTHNRTEPAFVGTPLDESRGGSALTHEIRLLVFETFELWHFFRRHYGSQRLSEYHLHLFMYPRRSDRLRVDIGIHRADIERFSNIFQPMRDMSALSMNVRYRITGLLWLSVNSRYGFRRVSDAPEGDRRFIVQRRFEPMAGLRIEL